jgi:heme exporter protein D
MQLLPDLGPHAVFIWLAYGAVALVIGALTLWIVSDDRRQRRRIAELEARGVRRRSAGPVLPGANP